MPLSSAARVIGVIPCIVAPLRRRRRRGRRPPAIKYLAKPAIERASRATMAGGGRRRRPRAPRNALFRASRVALGDGGNCDHLIPGARRAPAAIEDDAV